jgi:hypothetical protein
VATCDAILICVPTPLTTSREPDLTYLLGAANSIAGVLQPGQLVVLESTTYPRTTRDQLAPILAESGLEVGKDFFLAFSPARIDPGRTDFTVRTTPKLVGGITAECTERARALYAEICETVGRSPLLTGDGRALKAAREHLPLGQHRLGQLPRYGWPLPARRSLLPCLQGQRAHRAASAPTRDRGRQPRTALAPAPTSGEGTLR